MNILTALHAKRYAAGNRKDQKQYKAPKNLSLASHTSCYCWDSSMAIWARRISGVVYHYNRLRAINRVMLIRKRSRRRRIHGLRLIGPSRRLIVEGIRLVIHGVRLHIILVVVVRRHAGLIHLVLNIIHG